jgi:hypothetical protein
MADHNSTVSSTPASRPARRSPVLQARVSNDPLAPPLGLNPRSSEGRRWRDLALVYSAQLGPERMAREDVRTRLRSVLWLSVEVDRLQGERLCDRPVPLHSVLHATQELRTLLQELGLSEPQGNGSGLRDYLNGAAP